MKKFLLIGGVVVVAFLIIRAVMLQQPDTTLKYTVVSEDLVDTVQVSGTYTTAGNNPVLSPTIGTITKLYVKNNDVVKKNQPLFFIESTSTQDQKAAARANYLAAKAVADSDQATLHTLQSTMYGAWKKYTDLSTNATYQNSDGSPNTLNRIVPEFTTAHETWLAAEANVKNQSEVIAKDQASLTAAQLSYSETQSTKVLTPAAGTVVNLLKNVGDGVDVTSKAVLSIVDFAHPHILATMSEDSMVNVAEGQPVQIVFDADKNQTFTGTVENVDTVGVNTNGVITYGASIVAPDITPNIKPNMTALLTIETLRKKNVLDVPNSAIITQNQKTYVKDAHTHQLIEVTLGIKGMTKTEVASGLTANTVIVANP